MADSKIGGGTLGFSASDIRHLQQVYIFLGKNQGCSEFTCHYNQPVLKKAMLRSHETTGETDKFIRPINFCELKFTGRVTILCMININILTGKLKLIVLVFSL